MPDRGRHAKWVSAYVGKNQWTRKVNGQYHLYGIESGKEVFLGIVTIDGLIESDEQVEKKTYYVYEYGASRALMDLCPSRWKASMGTGWEQCLLYIISEISPKSYLVSQGIPERPNGLSHLARKKLDLFLANEYSLSIREIYSRLNGVRLLIDKKTGQRKLSSLSEDQIAFARGLNLNLEIKVL